MVKQDKQNNFRIIAQAVGSKRMNNFVIVQPCQTELTSKGGVSAQSEGKRSID